MGQDNILFVFEEKYSFLYELLVEGVPVYTSFRDGVLQRLRDGAPAVSSAGEEPKSKASVKRIWQGFCKKRKYKKAKTLIFTSSVYRRDKGRNLAAEYLLEKYPDGVVFEWPSRNGAYDNAYFTDPNKDKYCPLDYLSVKWKLFSMFHKKEFEKLAQECRGKLQPLFDKNPPETENERLAVEYLLEELPRAYATTALYQELFAKYFKGYKNVQYAIDFWGGARENIIPALQGKPESIELQHGIITGMHPGYVYPSFVKSSDLAFFKRKLLVYGEGTKEILCKNSIFDEARVDVIGNPRTQTYKKVFGEVSKARKWILFASQPYEQDGVGRDYYKTVIPYLQEVQRLLKTDEKWSEYKLAIKLHPRENNGVIATYKEALDGVEIFDNASELYELLLSSFVQLTVSSTTLYEAAEFGTPTIAIPYNGIEPKDIYGFEVWETNNINNVSAVLAKLLDSEKYEVYLNYLAEQTKNKM